MYQRPVTFAAPRSALILEKLEDFGGIHEVMLHFKLAPCEEAARNLAAVILDFLVSTYALVRPLILKLCSKLSHNLSARSQMAEFIPYVLHIEHSSNCVGERSFAIGPAGNEFKRIILHRDREAVATCYLDLLGCQCAMKVILLIVHRPAPFTSPISVPSICKW